MKAMVIDDSRAIRVVLKGILTDLGFEVSEAGHGQDALDLLSKDGAVDLALVDWNMPVMDGLQFVKSVRALPEYAQTKLVMVTTETETSQMASALEAGANEYVKKPFTKEVLSEKLELLGISGN